MGRCQNWGSAGELAFQMNCCLQSCLLRAIRPCQPPRLGNALPPLLLQGALAALWLSYLPCCRRVGRSPQALWKLDAAKASLQSCSCTGYPGKWDFPVFIVQDTELCYCLFSFLPVHVGGGLLPQVHYQ